MYCFVCGGFRFPLMVLFVSADKLVNLKYMESVSDELEQSVDMLHECVRIREGQLTLPGDFCDAVNDIICFLCTD